MHHDRHGMMYDTRIAVNQGIYAVCCMLCYVMFTGGSHQVMLFMTGAYFTRVRPARQGPPEFTLR